MLLFFTAHPSPTIHVCFRAKHIKVILRMKTRLLCCNIWLSIFKFIFLKGGSTNPAVFCCFCLKVFFCGVFLGGTERGMWERGTNTRRNNFTGKKKELFWWKLTRQPKGCREEEFHRHRERWWLAYYMMLLVTCPLTPLY